MAFKRALVVDDSRSARVALKQLLTQHDLIVEFAESGEEALAFLDHELVDVIFMDHHMPGMDGLEAVRAIKRNPRTATIPVMMYTTREGEVYVSQARALGAVGVLPKQVHPGVLFNMLLELGLVRDRRSPVPTAGEIAAAGSESVDDVDQRLNEQALGISLQSVVSRILEDQHLSLRADILRGHRDFARQVASEILTETRAERAEAQAAAAPRGTSQRVVTLLTIGLLVPALVLGGLYLRAADQRDAALARARDLDRQLEERLQLAESVTSGLLSDINAERGEVQSKHLAGLVWSLNESGSHGFRQPAFDQVRLRQLRTLLDHLTDIGFEGTVRLTSHLGEFCLAADRLGNLVPAPDELPVEECATIGHPLDGSSFASERSTVEFEAFLEEQLDPERFRVELVANDRFASTRRYEFPSDVASAAEWNAVAARNNRVEYSLIPRRDV